MVAIYLFVCTASWLLLAVSYYYYCIIAYLITSDIAMHQGK